MERAAAHKTGMPKGTKKPKPACGENWRKDEVTDRALRYRSQAAECQPEGARVCNFCGAEQGIMVGHIDGHEEHVEPDNLAWTCRSCNAKMAVALNAAGLGRKTRQFNPPNSDGAHSLGQWLTAVMAMRGESDEMSVRDAVAMVRATPRWRRSSFAHEIWTRRRARQSPVPF